MDLSSNRRKLIDRRTEIRRQWAAATTDEARARYLDKIFVLGRQIAKLDAKLAVKSAERLRVFLG